MQCTLTRGTYGRLRDGQELQTVRREEAAEQAEPSRRALEFLGAWYI